MFGRFGMQARRDEAIASRLYDAIVAQARDPRLYRDIGAPDTLDGRFDMLVLHLVLMNGRLDAEGPAGKALGQRLFDRFATDMDRTLRQMGVGDLSVPRRVRQMAESFYGRMKAYRPAIAAGDLSPLAGAIVRNVFPDEPNASKGEVLARYALAAAASLEKLGFSDLVAARLPDLAAMFLSEPLVEA